MHLLVIWKFSFLFKCPFFMLITSDQFLHLTAGPQYMDLINTRSSSSRAFILFRLLYPTVHMGSGAESIRQACIGQDLIFHLLALLTTGINQIHRP